MKKIKNWLKHKLTKFLGIDILESDLDMVIKLWKQDNAQLEKSIRSLEKNQINSEIENSETFNNIQKRIDDTNTAFGNKTSHLQNSIDVLHNTVENVVHIGTDVHRENTGHSWAVVCIEGKMNIVKFIDLHRRDARDILDFLKHFEAGRHCVDYPSSMFYDGLFKL